MDNNISPELLIAIKNKIPPYNWNASQCLIIAYLYFKFIDDKFFVSKKEIFKNLPILGINNVQGITKQMRLFVELYCDIKITPYIAKDLIISAYKQDIKKCDIFDLQCEWCECFVARIESHHFPIPKHKGGVDTVDICSNCHYGFHSIYDNKSYFALNKNKITEIFKNL